MTISESRVSYAGFNTRQLTLDGTGPCIVLLHGFGHPSDSWHLVLAKLAENGNAAIAVDLPGFGDADPLQPGPVMPQLDEFVADLVTRTGKRERIVLVGNSLGAAAAVRAASGEPKLPIGALVPTGTAGFGWTPLVHALTRADHSVLKLALQLPVPDALRHRVVEILLYGDPRTADPRMVGLLSEQVKRLSDSGELTRLVARFASEVISTAVAPIDCATTVVHGRRDRIVSLDASRRLHDAIPGSQFVLLDHAGHCPHLDAPAVIASIASDHAAALRSRSKPA